jgi:hypothetical protein
VGAVRQLPGRGCVQANAPWRLGANPLHFTVKTVSRRAPRRVSAPHTWNPSLLFNFPNLANGRTGVRLFR